MDGPLNARPLGQMPYSPLHNSDDYHSNKPSFVKFGAVVAELWNLENCLKKWYVYIYVYIYVYTCPQTALSNASISGSMGPIFTKFLQFLDLLAFILAFYFGVN